MISLSLYLIISLPHYLTISFSISFTRDLITSLSHSLSHSLTISFYLTLSPLPTHTITNSLSRYPTFHCFAIALSLPMSIISLTHFTLSLTLCISYSLSQCLSLSRDLTHSRTGVAAAGDDQAG